LTSLYATGEIDTDEIAQRPVLRGSGGDGLAKEEVRGMKEEELKRGNAGQIPCESQSSDIALLKKL
jgi:hypothetical protein